MDRAVDADAVGADRDAELVGDDGEAVHVAREDPADRGVAPRPHAAKSAIKGKIQARRRLSMRVVSMETVKLEVLPRGKYSFVPAPCMCYHNSETLHHGDIL